MITVWVVVKISQNVPKHQTALGALVGGGGKVDKPRVPQLAPVTE